jgi:hypothetical protein
MTSRGASLAPQEVRHLARFVDGAIMDPDVRQALHRSWGPCPRHSWGYAVVELELRGGRPFGTSILWEDLTRRAARVARGPRSVALRRLRGRGRCFTCEHLALPEAEEREARAAARRVNRLSATRLALELTREEWEPRTCPACAGGGGPTCRLHLDERTAAGLAGELTAIADRLDRFVHSMTYRGEPATPAERASWVEALGWFAGWCYPLAALRGH